MKRFDSINMIPLIDVMLVMLAIVLTTATFTATGRIHVDLPNSQGRATQEQTPLMVTIDKDKNVYADDAPVTLEGLKQRLAGLASTYPVTLKVDAAAPFEAFIGVVDLLKERDMNKISILTERRS